MRYLILVFVLFTSSVYAETLLIKTNSGYFWCEVVQGEPGAWKPIDTAFDRVVDMTDGGGDNGGGNTDIISIRVDGWADAADDPATRYAMVSIWNEQITCVENKECSLQEAEDNIAEQNVKLLKKLDAGKRAAWTVFIEKVATGIDEQKRRGNYSVKTLKSIYKGLLL